VKSGHEVKISIITVCLNSKITIRETIESVLRQNHKPTEFIIIDGGSVDETLKIIAEYEDSIDLLVSEPDGGIYDAMNKGIARATGEIVGILNSDDLFASNTVLSRVVREFEAMEVDAVFGDLVYVDDADTTKVVRNWESSAFIPAAFSRGWHPPHPTFYARKKVYDDFGLFDTNMKISADFEIMMRFLEVHSVPSKYIPETLVLMRTGGESNKSIRNIFTGNWFIYEAFKKHGIRYPWSYFPMRVLRKLLQFRVGQQAAR